MAVQLLAPPIGTKPVNWMLLPVSAPPVTPAVPVINFDVVLPTFGGPLEVAAVAGAAEVVTVIGSVNVPGVVGSVTLGAIGSVNVPGTDAGLEVEAELP